MNWVLNVNYVEILPFLEINLSWLNDALFNILSMSLMEPYVAIWKHNTYYNLHQ